MNLGETTRLPASPGGWARGFASEALTSFAFVLVGKMIARCVTFFMTGERGHAVAPLLHENALVDEVDPGRWGNGCGAGFREEDELEGRRSLLQ